eukprot:TRINITY_DN72439_c0_g1_i1.p1 TRINITY_DN72439_c0_g1~~TRINITY_DN72439_c0_g1_i1.p1  ORF type:complete len:217 (-),score=40.46 TRINITY_DN72439_c0_g1_i1:111-761(-)
MSSQPLSGVDSRGIATKSDYPAMPVPALYATFISVFGAIGVGVAFAVYSFGAKDKYDAKISLLASYELGWLYLSLFVIKLGILGININLAVHRKTAKVNVPDQQVYTVFTGSSAPMGYVLMEKEGDIGRFNRAQRALQNLFEQLPLFLVYLLAAGFVFPFPAFVLACFFMTMRIVSAVGYTTAPAGRMAGNMLGGLGMEALQGLVLLAGAKAIMRA